MTTKQLSTSVTIADAGVSAVRASIENYILGNSAQEQGRACSCKQGSSKNGPSNSCCRLVSRLACACSTSAVEWATCRCSPPDSLEPLATSRASIAMWL